MHSGSDPSLSWIGLSNIPGVGRITFRKLMRRFGSPEHVLSASRDELESIEGLSHKVINEIITFPWRTFAEEELLRARSSGVTIVTMESPAYPEVLRKTSDPPLYLYVRGELPGHTEEGIALVGTRRPSNYGLTVTHRLAYELASAGLFVVSGMARGIDTQAHKSALAAHGRTVAVLGSGIDVAYPSENRGLMSQIASSGAVISENPFGTKPEGGYFPARNRIISGLSRGTVIIEAAEDSGSLITADYALKQGRQLFAVPGTIVSQNSRGTNSLIKRGARLVEGTDDILEAFTLPRGAKREAENARNRAPLTSEEKTVVTCITSEPKHIDRIMAECSTTPGRISGLLIALELKGMVKQLPGKYFVID